MNAKQLPTRKEFEALYKIVKLIQSGKIYKRYAIIYTGNDWGNEFVKDWGEVDKSPKIIKFNTIANAKRFLKDFINKRKSHYQD